MFRLLHHPAQWIFLLLFLAGVAAAIGGEVLLIVRLAGGGRQAPAPPGRHWQPPAG